jgi:WD40 repeat protein/serine/threonine protein kinase
MSDETQSLPPRSSLDERLEQVLAEYLRQVEQGAEVDQQALLAAHPDLADDLKEFFRNQLQMQRLIGAELPVSSPVRMAPAKLTYFGDYEILEVIAQGGMGIVYKARQTKLNRLVAVKMILAGQLANQSDVKRFQAEAEAAANLHHPGIVGIYEVGMQDGQHYYSMEYIDGKNLAQIVREQPLPIATAAEYIRDIATVLKYAHEQKVLHRDLKPSNILLDAHGRVRITDFGLAKRVEGESDLTMTGQILGTPSYMSPEQAAAQHAIIGPATDIYALGAILYEFVTGRPPFRSENVAETLRQVQHDEPVRPRLLNPKLPRDLETICLKCLEKEPRRRYGSAQLLADDLGRFLRGEPILARPISRPARAWRWCKRNSVVATLIATVAASFIAGTTLSTYFAIQSAWRADENFQLAQKETKARDLAEKRKTQAETSEKRAEQRRKDAEENARLARKNLYTAHMNLVQNNWEDNQVGAVFELLDRYLPQPKQDDLRGFEWFYWHRLSHRELRTLSGHAGPVWCVAFSREGTRIASASYDGSVKVWDTATGEPTLTITIKGRTPVSSVAFNSDGTRIATASWNRERTVTLWDTSTGEEKLTLKGHTGTVNSVAFSDDGSRIVSASSDKTVRLWNATTGMEIVTLSGHTAPVKLAVLSPDGTRIASASEDGTARVWDTNTNKETVVFREHAVPVLSVAFSPDGTRIASGGGAFLKYGAPVAGEASGELKIWDSATGRVIRTLLGHTNQVTSVAFSPDGSRLASASFDQTVRLWDTATGQHTGTLKGHTREVLSVAFSRDGKRMASATYDHQVKLWDAATGQESENLKGHTQVVTNIMFSKDSSRLASTSADKSVKIWDSVSRQEASQQRFSEGVKAIVFGTKGVRIARLGADHTLKVSGMEGGNDIVTLKGHTGTVYDVVFSSDGSLIVSASGDKTVKLWDAATGQLTQTFAGHTGPVTNVVISRDGSRIASSSHDKTIRLWEVATGKESKVLAGHKPFVTNAITLSPNGTQLASGSFDKSIKLWDVALGTELVTMRGHTSVVWGLAFSPDGSRIASASNDQTVKLWDVGTGQETITLKGHAAPVRCVAFNAAGDRLASGGDNGAIKLWDAPRVGSR